jgi:hypothetical protein
MLRIAKKNAEMVTENERWRTRALDRTEWGTCGNRSQDQTYRVASADEGDTFMTSAEEIKSLNTVKTSHRIFSVRITVTPICCMLRGRTEGVILSSNLTPSHSLDSHA